MSDIKQAILDELHAVAKSATNLDSSFAVIASIGVIEKHLEGMVIVSAEPTEEMLDRGYDISDAGAELRDVYKFMIGTLEASK